MEYSKIRMYQSYKDEDFSYEELAEIQEAFDKIPDGYLRDLRENALVDDMLEELETYASDTEKLIYEYIKENYGESEAQDPSYYITPLAQYLNDKLNVVDVK